MIVIGHQKFNITQGLLKIKTMKKILTLLLITSFSIGFSQKKITLVIDAGHGGTDPGNLRSDTGLKQEKDLNLSMALQFGDYVEMYLGHEVEIIYTRKTDTFIELIDRIKVANDINANYFISIHCNSSTKTEVFGTETHIHNLNTKKSSELANMVESQFQNKAGRSSRGVKLKTDRRYNLQVLKDSKMPAILVETGFMTNKEEEIYLNSEKGQDLIVSAIFRSFRNFLKKNHDISMRTPMKEAPIEENRPTWKIQIMASTGPVGLLNPDFTSLNKAIEEVKLDNPTTPFNYKYYVGTYKDKKDAKQALKEVRKSAFSDAFLVKFE
jgi:N-acetylmuramoyl-L-alanine amidase|tara:strand:- start:68 stop:1042 length:975 start_codon:yes stop_codon:yes gene_type:complete